MSMSTGASPGNSGAGGQNLTQAIQFLRAIAQAISSQTSAIQAVFPTFQAAPATATSPGVPGQVAYDATHFYICVASNTWVRATLSTF
jgi:hypothetical protein